ncbi:FliC/FljB family flagellin [Variovorax sp. V59]|jgi:flagellin|uniref:Flagellin n=2 Tax=Variovorax TaxID=34072 RepID=A0AAE3XYD9_VARPD|nr:MULTISPECIES: FliC/FljB family flagellin [Variovorax]MBD9662754.1 FliC/FljB family flagellin [Variovorax sp. VRV01]MDP9963164.1 flagellin [Variovorax paradoxus]MDR6426584.1 flagellin [Variovorax paradoxus]MDR6451163.1 flagellin [Variovorax paradoxus]TWD78767.1 flagellin [Variovorax beijingensis]
MAQVINTNSLSLLTQNNLNASQSSLNTAIQRLSSGLRINSAKDDAAGQAIANRFTANIRGLTQASRNANDGISLAQTTEGALKEVNNNLQRVRELSVQAANGSNSASDLQSIQDEIKLRLGEIDRVSKQTDFNGVKVLSSSAKPLTVQVGANDGETIDIDLKEISSKTLGMQGFNVAGPAATAAFAFDGVTGSAAGDAPTAAQLKSLYGSTTAVTTTTVAEKTTDDLSTKLGLAAGGATLTGNTVADKNGNLFAEVSITPTGAGETSSLINQGFTGAVDGTAMFRYIALDPASADTATTAGTAAFTVDTSKVSVASLQTGSTASPLEAIDAALKQVDDLRSSLGAVQNRFDSVISNLGTAITNLSSSRSRIEDADYATEVSNMTRAQILQQAGTSVLAQANQTTQGVLSLLR